MLKSETKELQSKLGKYVRTNKSELGESVREERLHHYRRLVRNIVDGSISSAYPITKKVLNEDEWQNLINDFLSNHNSHEPQVWKYPLELIKYFEKEDYHNEILKKGFLLDLLKFEWMEMEVYGMEDIDIEDYSVEMNPKSKVILNPHYLIEHFQYPVHKKNYKEIEKAKGDYFVLCYRKISNLELRYLSLSPLDTMIFEFFENGISIDEIERELTKITGESNDSAHKYLIKLINTLKEKEIILCVFGNY